VIRSRRTLVALLTVFALLLLAACGDSDDSSDSGGDTSSTSSAGPAPESGNGTLVLGAEQEMDCADWISSCAGASWGVWTLQEHTMPRVWDFAKQNGTWTNVPNIMMAEAPTATDVNGKQTITYKINPAAVWSDGEPITSEDFKYTWEQIATGKDIYDQTGYKDIESVDTSDPKTAIVTMEKPFGGWTQLFGALYGIMPSHILEGKNRAKAMTDGYDWSGGPWIGEWNRGSDVTLTPNPNWYGPKPKLAKVIFRFLANTSAEFQAFKNGEVLAIYPQPQLDAIDQITSGIEGAESVYTADTGNIEALWMNNAKFPFDSLAVRQAFAYSLDRDAIVNRLFGGLGVTEAVNSLNPPILSEFSDPSGFEVYTKDLDKVDQLMTGDGWEKNGDGVWAKGGKTATITIKTTTENQRRELTEQIIQEQAEEAGFDVKIKNEDSATLFGESAPQGNFQLALYAQVATSLEPGLCSLMCSENVPSKANDQSGQNWTRTKVAELDPPLQTVESSQDRAERIAASKQADVIMGENMVSLPIDPLPNIGLWSTRITGVAGDNPVLAIFWNLHEWDLAS
jgi:peptide/nickel transport system substrate-binding protein